MSTADEGRSAADEFKNGEDCPGDSAADDDQRLRSRLGKFTIGGDDMSDVSASANHRFASHVSLAVRLKFKTFNCII